MEQVDHERNVCQLQTNPSPVPGAGVYSSAGGVVRLVNATLSGNTATSTDGGGLHSRGTSVLTYTTVAHNTSSTGAGGVQGAITGTVMVYNTILAYNGSANCGGSVTSNGYNLDTGDTCGLSASGDITSTDPLLGPLTQDGSTWVHPLPVDSPAVNAGECVLGINIDQRGVPRPVGAGCDVGSYEYGQFVYLPLVLRGY